MTERNFQEGIRPRFIEGTILVIPFEDFDIKVAVASSQQKIEELKDRIDHVGSPNGFNNNLLPDGKTVLLSGNRVNRFQFYNPHKTESSDRTNAIYLYQYKRPMIEFLVQYLGPRGEDDEKSGLYTTSFHGGHGPEFFAVLDGTLYISDGNRARRLSRGRLEYIPENEPHICYTLGGTAITAILKTGDLFHRWLPKPAPHQLIEQARLIDKI